MVERLQFGWNNCYIVYGEKKNLLIDTASEQYSAALLDAIRRKNIGLLLLTHGHIDHIGGAALLAKKLSIPIAMAQADEILIQQPQARPLFATSPLGHGICWHQKRVKPVPFFLPDFYVTHGQRLEEYGIAGRIVALPGHTAGSIGVWTANKEFIVGDALMHIGLSKKPLIYEQKKRMLQSCYDILESDAVAIYMGHGEPIFRKPPKKCKEKRTNTARVKTQQGW